MQYTYIHCISYVLNVFFSLCLHCFSLHNDLISDLIAILVDKLYLIIGNAKIRKWSYVSRICLAIYDGWIFHENGGQFGPATCPRSWSSTSWTAQGAWRRTWTCLVMGWDFMLVGALECFHIFEQIIYLDI